MTKIDDIIDSIIKVEGPETNDPNDKGGRTQYGISEKSNPQAWSDGKVTEEEARTIYFNKYVKGPRFDQITDLHLQAQLVDFGVNSGPFIAISKLQNVLEIPVDGILGPNTLTKLNSYNDYRFINNLLVGQRVKMIGQIVKKNPSQLEYINGWLNRAVSFLR